MSEIFHTRAAEIIAAYGADPARWPEAERATAQHVIAASPELTAALAAARALDVEMAAWATAPVVVAPRAAADVAAQVARRPRPRWGWAVGTGVAASLAAGLALMVSLHASHPVATHAPVSASDDATAFAQVFTPTPDEEQSL